MNKKILSLLFASTLILGACAGEDTNSKVEKEDTEISQKMKDLGKAKKAKDAERRREKEIELAEQEEYEAEQEEYKYVTFIQEKSGAVSEKRIDFLESLHEIVNGEITSADQWKENMLKATGGIIVNANEIIDYENIPDKFYEAHYFLVLAMENYKESVDLFIESLNNDSDDEYLEKALNTLVEADEYLKTSDQKMSIALD